MLKLMLLLRLVFTTHSKHICWHAVNMNCVRNVLFLCSFLGHSLQKRSFQTMFMLQRKICTIDFHTTLPPSFVLTTLISSLCWVMLAANENQPCWWNYCTTGILLRWGTTTIAGTRLLWHTISIMKSKASWTTAAFWVEWQILLVTLAQFVSHCFKSLLYISAVLGTCF